MKTKKRTSPSVRAEACYLSSLPNQPTALAFARVTERLHLFLLFTRCHNSGDNT